MIDQTTPDQTTIGRSVSLDGAGVHSNAAARLTLHPADAGTGIVFQRTGLPRGRECFIEAHWSKVGATELGTTLGSPEAGSVATVEHVLAALAGLGVDNALVEIDGPEAPILDGSAEPFVAAIEAAGIVTQPRKRRYIEILTPVRATAGLAFAELRPAKAGFSMDVEIDFADAVIGRQRRRMNLTPRNFARGLARARTFGFVADVERLWKAGFALGASLENTVAISGSKVVNAGGLRFADEFVRHKMLDVVGDLSLAGAPIVGAYRSFRGGHRLNLAVLQALFANRDSWRMTGTAPVPIPQPAVHTIFGAAALAPDRN